MSALVTIVFIAGGLLACVAILCVAGTLVGLVSSLRCPRCGRLLVWVSGWQRAFRPRWLTTCICLRCRELITMTRSNGRWAEATSDDL